MLRLLFILTGLILTILGIRLNNYWIIVSGLLVMIFTSIKLTELKENLKGRGDEA